MKMLEGLISAALTVAIIVLVALLVPGDAMTKLKVATGYGALFIALFSGVLVLVSFAMGRIDIASLFTELGGGASLSRFQLFIFTIVVAMSLLIIVSVSQKLPEVPTGVLTLLGISATTYGVSKGIQAGTNLTKGPPAAEAGQPPGEKS